MCILYYYMEKNIFMEEEATKTRKWILRGKNLLLLQLQRVLKRTLKEQEYILYIYIQYIFMQITGTGNIYLHDMNICYAFMCQRFYLCLEEERWGGWSCRPGGEVRVEGEGGCGGGGIYKPLEGKNIVLKKLTISPSSHCSCKWENH